MSSSVFSLFKDPLYTATVKRGGEEVVSYNVRRFVPPNNEDLEKAGVKMINLVYEPIGKILGNSYIDVKKILFETIIQINQGSITDEIVFSGDNNEQIRERNLIIAPNVANPPGATTISFILNIDGSIERTILGKSARDTYVITYRTQTTPPSEPNYKLWFYVMSIFTLVFALLITILSIVKRVNNETGSGKTWFMFALSLILIIISVVGIFVVNS
jgi:hypothetical protein